MIWFFELWFSVAVMKSGFYSLKCESHINDGNYAKIEVMLLAFCSSKPAAVALAFCCSFQTEYIIQN